MFKKYLLILTLLLCTRYSQATHLMGGEITWQCAGSGNYIFTMKLYRDCNGSMVSSSPSLTVTGHPTITTIPLSLIAQNDISPSCNAAGPVISCAAAESQPGWPNSSSTIAGAVQESVFRSAPIALPGVPPASGWIFSYDECCRNPAVSNLQNPGTLGMTLRAVMYAYNGMNAGPCFDSSPEFLASPSSVICLGYPFTYNHNAFDRDKDSLAFFWATPYSDISGTVFNPPTDPVPLTFASGYNVNSPLPGPAQSSVNVPAAIDVHTGEISFTSFTQGNFVTVVKVESWKCGQLVAEVYREMQIVLLPCAPNSPPVVNITTFQDTVPAGTLVNFTLSASDPGFLSDGITPQTVTIDATGSQFGTGFSTTGCGNPPCASLTAAPPVSGSAAASTTFSWQTSCNHLATSGSCSDNSNTYTFVFRSHDDFCPAPAERITTVSITVLGATVVPSPQPTCASVLPNGDAMISWIPPVDPDNTFSAYMIYSAPSLAGPYTLTDSVFTLGTNNYIHVGAGSDLAPVYYFIRTRSGCNQLAAAADTIRTMHLSVVNPADGTAQLSWNSIATPLPATASGLYNVYLEFPAGTWTLAGSTTSTSFRDTIFACNSFLRYRVEMADNSGCVSVSSVDTGTFQNMIVPEIPLIDTLGVDDNNLATLSWNSSPSPDAIAYVIYRYNGSGWVPIDTVYGINNTSYNYLLSTAGTASEDYRLAAFDSCGNISPLGTPRSTIFLTATADICARSAILSWNDYGLIGASSGGYRIYSSTASATGPWTLIGNAAPGATTFTASSLLPSTMYYFKISAFDAADTRTASSNRISFFSAIPVPPAFSYLRQASVTGENRITITTHVDATSSTQKFKIMRSRDDTVFTLAGTVLAGGSTPVSFTDTHVNTERYSYYYKVINVDSCGFDGIETNIGRSILMTAVSNPSEWTNSLSWNDYESWSGSVMSYSIYRGIDGVFDPSPIATVPYTSAGLNNYVDDVSSFLQGRGVFNYYVMANEGMGNIYGFADSALSNVAEAYQDAHVFIPNAFVPGGLNNVFIPVTTYVGITDYKMMIFNRWGLKVFESDDQDQGWDGTRGGTKQEQGAYVYLLRFKDSRGEFHEMKGTVTLIR